MVDVLREIANFHQATVAQVALAWVRQQSGITSTIIGAKRIEQLKDNIASLKVVLSAEELQKINEVSPLTKQYPGWMVERQSVYRNQE